jgi:hypothetical protein
MLDNAPLALYMLRGAEIKEGQKDCVSGKQHHLRLRRGTNAPSLNSTFDNPHLSTAAHSFATRAKSFSQHQQRTQ